MKKVIALFAVLVFISHVYGQDVQESTTKSNEFGSHLGATTGIGLSYRHWFKNVGVQFTVLPINTSDLTFVSAAITGLYSLKETKSVRAYFYLGNHFLYSETRNNDYPDNNETKYKRQYNIGFGPGFSFGSVVGFNLMFGYGLYDVFNKFYMFPTGEIGLYFKF